jgi:hypothetical protein
MNFQGNAVNGSRDRGENVLGSSRNGPITKKLMTLARNGKIAIYMKVNGYSFKGARQTGQRIEVFI